MTDAPKRHADGVYLDLPIAEYVADDAVGGHAVFTLATSPTDWRWQRPDNPLWKEPKSDAKELGRLIHCLLVEGRAAFDRQFAAPPKRAMYPDALETGEDFKRRLRELEAAHMAKLGVEKLSRDERQPFLLSGKNEELVARIKALDPAAMFWDELVDEIVGERVRIDEETQACAELSVRLALAAYGDLLEIASPDDLGKTGLSEVSIFWTEGDVRFKARWDRITASRIVDVKKYGTTPKPQHSLRQHLVWQAATYGYAPQAVLQSRAAATLARRLDDSEGDGFPISGGDVDARALVAHIAEQWTRRQPAFWWLFLRSPGPPGGKPIPFRPSDAMWTRAEQMIDDAVFNLRRFRERFGEDLWLDAQDAEEISSDVGAESDWPAWAFQTPMEDR